MFDRSVTCWYAQLLSEKAFSWLDVSGSVLMGLLADHSGSSHKAGSNRFTETLSANEARPGSKII